MLYAAIVIAEILFWTFLLGGLFVRYGLKRRRAGGLLIAGAAFVTGALLVTAGVDLASGGEADTSHVVAAIAVAYTVVYGRRHLAKADAFVRRRLGEPVPEAAPRKPKAEREREGWLRHARMWALGTALLGAGVMLAGGFEEGERLAAAAGVWTAVLAIDFVVSYSHPVGRPLAAR
jgi:hypothetical protein